MSKLLTVGLVAFLAVSCRPTNKGGSESSTKSLDNVGKAASEQTVNSCGIKYTGSQTISATVKELVPRIEAAPRYKNAVIGALTAVPTNLLLPFVAAGGKIVVSDDAAAKCQGTPFSAGERELVGTPAKVPACWKIEPGQGAVIYLSPSVKLIRHNTVRMFGYFYTEFFVAKISDPAAPAPFTDKKWQAAATAFIAERDALAANFLVDLLPSNRPLHDSLEKIQTTDAKSFGNYIFAEALDSYYCSLSARSTFGREFKLTYQRFTNTENANSVVNQFGKR